MLNNKKLAIILTLGSFATTIANDFTAIIKPDTKDFYITVESEEFRNFSHWTNVGIQFNCNSWSPDETTIDYGLTFEQEQSCFQNKERTKDKYLVMTDGSSVYKETIKEEQTIIEKNKRNSIGTKNYVASNSSSSGSWTNSGGIHSCSSWTPATSTVANGVYFMQTRICKQNQVQTTTTYNHWADGSTTINSTTQTTQTVNQNQSRGATGTRAPGKWKDAGSYSNSCNETLPTSGGSEGTYCYTLNQTRYSKVLQTGGNGSFTCIYDVLVCKPY